ncbi:MAG: hypothetical protein QXF91_06605 [Desulfurococcaceae archaeon]
MRSYFKVYILMVRKRCALIVFPAVVLLVLSVLSAYALSSIRTLYYADKTLLGLGDSVVVSGAAISPFTSLVNSEELSRLLAGVKGVEVEYLFLTLAYLYDKPVVIHGVEEGVKTGCAHVGVDLVKSLHINVGEAIPVHSPFSDSTYFFEVCGLVEGPALLLNYEDAIKIRGVKPGYYTLAVIRAENREVLEEVYKALGLEPAKQKIFSRALLVLVRKGEKISVEAYENIIEGYLYRLGIYRDFVFYFAYAMVIISALSTPIIGVGLVVLLRREVYVLRLLGLSCRGVFLVLLTTVVVATLFSYALAQVIAISGLLPGTRVLGYYISPSMSVEDLICVHFVHLVMCITGAYIGLTRHAK